MKFGIDSKMFKHVKSDDKSTTLQHKDGHVLTIAHSNLSPKMRDQLSVLSKDKMSDGGPVPNKMPANFSISGMEYADGGAISATEKTMAPDFQDAKEKVITDPRNAPIYYPKDLPPKASTPPDTEPKKMAEGGEAQLPCLNPNCKSHGKSHPNCRCYGGRMAEGGMTVHYCRHGKPHQADCEYSNTKSLADGGEVAPPDEPMEPPKSNIMKDIQPDIQNKQALASFIDPSQRETADQVADRIGATPEQKEMAQNMGMGTAGTIAEVGPVAERTLTVLPSLIRDAGEHANSLAESLGVYHPSAQRAQKIYQGLKDQLSAFKIPSKKAEGGKIQRMANGGESHGATGSWDDASQDVPPPVADQASVQQPQTPAPAQPDQPQMAPVSGAPGQPQFQNNVAPQSFDESMQPPEVDPQDYSDAKRDEFLKEDADFAHDLNNGHITPKTYSDLFAKTSDGKDRGTLGKLGMMFGMLVSGAGSGLSHQPNAMIEMMKNEINNDLEAQKSSKANAQNFLRLSQAHRMNEANIQNAVAEGRLTTAQAQKALTEADSESQMNAVMKMNRTVAFNLAQQVSKLPPNSPQRMQAEQQLALLYNTINNEHYDMATRAAAASAMTQFGNPNGPSQIQPDPEQSFKQQNQALRLGGNKELADQREERHIPGVPGSSSKPIPQDTREKIQAMDVLDNKVKDVLDFAQKHRGTMNPGTLKTAKQKAEELISFYNKSVDSLGMTQGRLGWLEEQIKKNPTSLIEQVLGNNATLREIKDSNANRRLLQLKQLGFPIQQQQQQNQPVKGVDGRMYIKSPDGKFMIPVR